MKVNKNESAGSGVWMSVWLAGLGIVLTAANAQAQTNTAPARVTNRFLLIVETSSVMQNRADGAFRVVADLFTSGMGGQLQRGDTIGLWTFNNELHAGIYPLQGWSPSASARTNMAKHALNFLRAQKFEKKPRFDKVMPVLQQIVNGSEYITVIVISSGEAPLKGTPFDARVNEFYTTWRSQQKSYAMPFVAILRGQKGQFADCAIHWAPWPVDLPALPPELLAARVVKPATVAKTIAPASLPPLTFSGHKPSAEPASAPIAHNLTATNASPSATMLPPPNEAPARTATVPASAMSTPSVQARPSSITSQTEKASPASDLRTEAPRVQPASLAAATASAKPVVETAQAPAAIVSTNSIVSASAVPQTPHGVVEANGSTVSLKSALENPAAPPSVTPPAVTVLSNAPLLNGKLLWLAGGLGLVLVALIFLRWREHARPPLHVSLITRTFEREQD